MLASDKKFLKIQLAKKDSLPPEDEQGFRKAGRLESLFSAVGGAVITYATTKVLDKDEKNWFHYSMAILGGLLIARGARRLVKKNSSESKIQLPAKD